MTREEAIEELKEDIALYMPKEWVEEIDRDTPDGRLITALEMAIKALEAPPNDNWEEYSKRLWKSAYERGKEEAEPRWIPVTERLPEEYGEYMITWTTSHSMVDGKYGLLGIAEYELTGEYDAENNRFKGEWLLEEYVENYSNVKVTAWMPLPEPYMAESEDKE